MAKKWGEKDRLKSLKNPVKRNYEIGIECQEITFLGGDEKPDFAEIRIQMLPKEKIIELKSLKYYFYSFRNEHMSYERFMNVVFDDLMEIYDPQHLRIELEFRARGGIKSLLKIDSATV